MSTDFFGILIKQVGYHILLRDKYADNHGYQITI